MNEKLAPLNEKKIDKRLNTYIQKNYKEIINEVNIKKTKYEKTKYTKKIINKKNKKLYFYLYYSNKEIKSTYENDYIKGEKFLNYIENTISKNIKKKTNINYEIKIKTTYNKFNDYTKEKLLQEKNLESLSIYTLKEDFIIEEFNTNEIYNKITKLNNNLEKNNIFPKNYNITFILKKNPTKSIEINNLTSDLIKNNDLKSIINDIINKEKSDILKNNNITYKYYN